jgi:rhodanese-related sulfurtransferase
MMRLPKMFLWGAVKIAVAASVLGVAFNNVHPLGVRGSGSAPAEHVPLAAEAVEGLVNQTVGFRLISPALRAEPTVLTAHNEAHERPNSASDADVTDTTERPSVLGTFTWHQTKGLLANKRIVLVDARTHEAFAAGHIPGAVSLPANFTAEEIADFQQNYPKTTPIVVYCASVQCPLSRRLAARLSQQHGYVEVRDMPGGYAEWRLNENALAKNQPAARTSP